MLDSRRGGGVAFNSRDCFFSSAALKEVICGKLEPSAKKNRACDNPLNLENSILHFETRLKKNCRSYNVNYTENLLFLDGARLGVCFSFRRFRPGSTDQRGYNPVFN